MAAKSSEAGPGAEPGKSSSGGGAGNPGSTGESSTSRDTSDTSDTTKTSKTSKTGAVTGTSDTSGSTSSTGLWHHGADLVRVTAIDLAVLAGHMLLYPTGILPERLPGPPVTATHDSPGDTPTGSTPVSAEGRDHPPVLLLHGFVDNRSAFALLRRSLLRNGWPRVQALNYSPLTTDIRTAAEALGPHIEQICEQSGHGRVDIVAHSLGGLVARYYVQRLGGDARVRTLVTLGTPHSGTRAVAALSPHPLARQMRPGSEVLAELAEPAKGCRTRFVAFWSDLDQVMIPVESARLEHPDLWSTNIKVTGIGHLSLPVHSSVAAEIRRALSGRGPLRDAVDAA